MFMTGVLIPCAYSVLACEKALGGKEGERKEDGMYAHLRFYCSTPFLTFL